MYKFAQVRRPFAFCVFQHHAGLVLSAGLVFDPMEQTRKTEEEAEPPNEADEDDVDFGDSDSEHLEDVDGKNEKKDETNETDKEKADRIDVNKEIDKIELKNAKKNNEESVTEDQSVQVMNSFAQTRRESATQTEPQDLEIADQSKKIDDRKASRRASGATPKERGADRKRSYEVGGAAELNGESGNNPAKRRQSTKDTEGTSAIVVESSAPRRESSQRPEERSGQIVESAAGNQPKDGEKNEGEESSDDEDDVIYEYETYDSESIEDQ